MLIPTIAVLMCTYSLASFAKRHQRSFVLFAIMGLFSSAFVYISFLALFDRLLYLLGILIPFGPTLAGIIAAALYTYFLMVSLEKRWSIRKSNAHVIDDDIL